jgi:hypothetical protein
MCRYDAICRVARVGLPARPRVFSALAGASRRLLPPHARYVGIRARGGLALRLAGARLGKPPGSGGYTKGKQYARAGDNAVRRDSSADARDPRQVQSGKRSFSTVKVLNDRRRKVARSILRSIERNDFSISVFDFLQFCVFVNSRFRSIVDRLRGQSISTYPFAIVPYMPVRPLIDPNRLTKLSP